VPPGGCGLPFAYVRTEYIAGVTDLLTRVDLASNPNEGVAAREIKGEVNDRELMARRTSIDLEAFMFMIGASCG
jgi:hypothetical protein